MSKERSRSEVENACAGLSQELRVQRVHVIRVGKSALEGAGVTLRVYLENETASTDRRRVPAQYDDFPVKIIVSGRISPQ